jgi:hypothetical protein
MKSGTRRTPSRSGSKRPSNRRLGHQRKGYKSSTKPTRSLYINDEHSAIIAMANFVVLIPFLATDEKYQWDEDKKLVLVEWVKDIVHLICKKID